MVGWQNLVNARLSKSRGNFPCRFKSYTHRKKFMFLFKKEKERDFSEVFSEIKKLEEKLKKLSSEIEKLKERERKNFRKLSLLRFNPFREMGGNQSFTLVLLDEENNGFVITSLFGKDGSRVYAKPVVGGNSNYPLSEEERKAIEIAKNEKNFNTKNASSNDIGPY